MAKDISGGRAAGRQTDKGSESMADKDPVREYLREKGCADHVVREGLAGLAERWEAVVKYVEEGYGFGLDDYLNDLDVRQLIEESLEVAPHAMRDEVASRIRAADRRFEGLVEIVDRCLWGDEVAEEEGWTRESNWWYYARPLEAPGELLAEIDEAF